MEKNELQKVKESIVFYSLKDELSINTMAQLRYYLVEHKMENKVDGYDIYRRIVNYRIKKYGTSQIDMPSQKEQAYRYILNKYD